jgi:hypothetical protein
MIFYVRALKKIILYTSSLQSYTNTEISYVLYFQKTFPGNVENFTTIKSTLMFVQLQRTVLKVYCRKLPLPPLCGIDS